MYMIRKEENFDKPNAFRGGEGYFIYFFIFSHLRKKVKGGGERFSSRGKNESFAEYTPLKNTLNINYSLSSSLSIFGVLIIFKWPGLLLCRDSWELE